jgi:hypothetical protein
MKVNSISPTIAGNEAVKRFLKLESQGKLGSGGATYMFMGNAWNDKPLPGFFSLGIGKTTTVYAMKYLALHGHNNKPFRLGSPLPWLSYSFFLICINTVNTLIELGS